MDWAFFPLGMLGALLVVYLAKEEVIPAFRPLFDIVKIETELNNRQIHIKETQVNIDSCQNKLEDGGLSREDLEGLKIILRSSQRELREELKRVGRIEGVIRVNQIISRSIGFAIYVILGGVFACLLAGRINVEGLEGNLPNYFGAIIIGATWTSYLSVIGLRRLGKEASEQIEAIKKDIIETIKNETTEEEQNTSIALVDKATEQFDIRQATIQQNFKRLL